MSASEVIDRLAREAAHYRRCMWTDVVLGGLLALVAVVGVLMGADASTTVPTAIASCVFLGRASVYRSVRRDIFNLVLHYKLAMGGLIARDVQ